MDFDSKLDLFSIGTIVVGLALMPFPPLFLAYMVALWALKSMLRDI